MLKAGKSASEALKYHIQCVPQTPRSAECEPDEASQMLLPYYTLCLYSKHHLSPVLAPAGCLYVEPDVLAGCLPEAPVARVTHWIRTTEPYAEEPNYVQHVCAECRIQDFNAKQAWSSAGRGLCHFGIPVGHYGTMK